MVSLLSLHITILCDERLIDFLCSSGKLVVSEIIKVSVCSNIKQTSKRKTKVKFYSIKGLLPGCQAE